MHLKRLMIHSFVLGVLVVKFLLGVLLFSLLLFYLLSCSSDVVVGHPLVVSSVEGFVVDIVLVAGFVLRPACVVICDILGKVKKEETGLFCNAVVPLASLQDRILALYHLFTVSMYAS